MADFLDLTANADPQWRDAAGRFARAADAVDKELAQAAQRWGQRSMQDLRSATPVKTGTARQAWRMDWKPTQHEVVVTNRTPYLPILITGSRAHEIVPRQIPGVLRFIIGEDIVYARRVMHPGTRPSSELVAAMERLKVTAKEELEQAGVRVVQRLIRG